jgi:hypothetical protein
MSHTEAMLNGCVQAQGIKVNIENWLIMGSEAWNKTPDNIKAWAYQAACITGWTDEALIHIATNKYKHIDADMAKITIDLLKDLSSEHKLEVEQ